MGWSSTPWVLDRHDADAGQDDDVDAAILAASFRGVVAGDGMIFGEAGGGNAGRRELVIDDEDLGELGGAGGGELPVGGELHGVNGHVVGVTLDADVVGSGGNFGGDLVERAHGLRMGQSGTAVVEAGFAE